ncbi:Helicase conserved C-terminal domain [Ceratobasidium sp. AG-Ba]|nr:Helicase conserved C-terminal domain [Ceratobasidium sp. AG-Ba]
MPSQPVQLTEVPGYAGVFSCPVLDSISVGIILEYGILCCTASAHYRQAHTRPGMKIFTTAQISKMLDDYVLFPGNLNEIDPPAYPTPPLLFLPTHSGLMCPVCDEKKLPPFYWRTRNRGSSHFVQCHSDCMWRLEHAIPVELQSFSEAYSLRRDFRVTSSLINASQEKNVANGVSHSDLSKSFILHSTKASAPPLTTMSTLKEVAPFPLWSGWGAFMAGKDPALAQAWVTLPKQGPLHRILQSVQLLFKNLLTEIGRSPVALRKQLTDEEGSGGTDPLIALQSQESQQRYADTWAGILIFAISAWRKQQDQQRNHPTFHLCSNQKSWLGIAWAYANKTPGHAAARESILGLSVSLWLPDSVHHILKDMFNEPVMQFAVFSNVLADGSLQDPSVISSSMARIKYVMRISTLFWMIQHGEKESLPSNWMSTHINQTLRAATVSPFSSIYAAMGAAKKYPNDKSGAPKANWADDNYQTLLLNGEPCNLPQLRSANAALLDEIDAGLSSLLKGATPEGLGLNIMPDMKLHDSISNTATDYSFLSEPSNNFRTLEDALAVHILGSPESTSFQSGLDMRGKIIWKQDGVLDYLALHAATMKKMICSWQMLGGPPSRGEETTTLQLHNSAHKFRSILVVKGRLVAIVTYNKAGTQTRADKAVAHAFPAVVLRQFLIMNVLIRPFVCQLVHAKFGPEKQYIQQQYVFAAFGKIVTSEELSATLTEFFSKRMNCPRIGINMHRHAMIKIHEHYLPSTAELLESFAAVPDTMAGHSTRTGIAHYGLNSEERHMFLSSTLSKFMTMSALSWPLVLSRSHLLDSELKNASVVGGRVEQDHNSGNLSLAIPVATIVQQTVQTILPQIQDALVQNQSQTLAFVQEMFRNAFPSSTYPGQIIPPAVGPKHLVLLQRLTKNQNAVWKSPGQGQAMAYVLERQHSLLCVLPTGGGKSVLFTGPPLVEPGFTLVLAPLVALLQSYQAQLNGRADLAVNTWTSDLVVNEGLVLASLDDSEHPLFANWVLAAKDSKVLLRIVIDEGHLALTASYREIMGLVHRLVRYGVQLVVLSATVPPMHQNALCKAFGDPSWAVVRETTQRPEIAYCIVQMRNPNLALQALETHVNFFRPKIVLGETMLIHCRTVEHCKQVSRKLGAPVYHGGMSTQDRARVFQNWQSGMCPVLIATTAFGAGVHTDHCRVVFHYGAPWGMLEYGQETGRAGRDGSGVEMSCQNFAGDCLLQADSGGNF